MGREDLNTPTLGVGVGILSRGIKADNHPCINNQPGDYLFRQCFSKYYEVFRRKKDVKANSDFFFKLRIFTLLNPEFVIGFRIIFINSDFQVVESPNYLPLKK
jgi:hypothetical protein